jgi:peptidoglycan/LPS O-acetylase OafA/YrhL
MTGGDGAYHSGPLDAYDGGTVEPILRCMTGFVLGLLTFRAARTPRIVEWTAHDAVLGAVIVLLLVCFGAGAHDLPTYPLFAALVLGLYGNRRRVGRALGTQPLYWLGVVSYSIYLLHPLLVRPRRTLDGALQTWMPSPCADWTASVVAYTLLVLAGGMSYRLIEKPGRRWLMRLAAEGPRDGGGP